MVDLTDSSIPNEDKLAFTFLSVLKGSCFRDWPNGETNIEKSSDISILIPCYGKADTIVNTVQSAARQTLKAYKILILLMDEASAKMKGELENVADNVECVVSERLNVCAARNKLVKICPTEYFVLLDADDELADNFLEVCYKDEISIVFPAQIFSKDNLNKDGLADGDTVFRLTDADKNFFIDQNFTCLFHKTAFNEIGGFREKYQFGFEDTDLILRFLALQKYKFSTTIKTKSLYNETANGLTKNAEFFDSMYSALEEWFPFFQEQYKNKKFHLHKKMGDFLMSLKAPVSKKELLGFFNALMGTDINSLEGSDIPIVIMGELGILNSQKISASFSLSLECNKSCPYCGQLKERKCAPKLTEDQMYENFDKALTKCEKLVGGQPEVQILGGEPTLWSDNLVRKIQKRLENYQSYLVFTNGANKESLWWKDPKVRLDCHITDWEKCEKLESLPDNASVKIIVTKKNIHLLDKFFEANQDLNKTIILSFCHGGGEEYDLDIEGVKKLAETEWKWIKLFNLYNRVNMNFYERYLSKGLSYCQKVCRKYKPIWNFNCYNNTVSPCCMFKKVYNLEDFEGQEVEDCGNCLFFV